MSLLEHSDSPKESIKEIVIQENKSWPSKSEENIAKILELNESDKKLGEFLQERNILDFKLLQDKGLQISAKQYVGTVNFSKFRLKIIPKIYNKETKDVWKNLVTCMYFIEDYSLAKIIEFEENEFVDDNVSTLQEFIIWSLVFQSKELFRKGLLKSYIRNEDNLPFLRGKIILKNQFTNDVQKNVKFFCEYDELEYDNIDNRIIFHTLLQSIRTSISPKLKKEVFMLIEQFSGMVQDVPITVPDIERVMRSYSRQNMHYEDIHKLCKLILENTGISDFDGGKIPYSVPFFLDMNKVFEKFVTKLLERSFPGQITAQNRQRAWTVNNKNDNRFMIPDITLEEENTLKIIDVKYKPRLDPSDLYQIGFYIHEFKDKKRRDEDNYAFAILPDYPDESKDDKYFTSVEKKIHVFQRYVSIDTFLKLIRNKDKEERDMKLKEMLTPDFER